MTKACGQANSDPVVGERMISRDHYHQTPTEAAAAPVPANDKHAGPEHAGDPVADQAHPATEPVADSRCAASGQNSDTNANTEPAVNQPANTSHDEAGTGLEVYGDSAYGTGAARAAYRADGHDTVIKPKPLRPAIQGGFTLDDFDIDEDAGTVSCPAEYTRPMSATRTVSFGTLCAGCPLRARCTTAAESRSMTIHPHEDPLRAARAQARTPRFTQAYPTRSTIERIIAWTATQNGRRIKLRYHGVAKNHAWLRTRSAAINLRTLINHGLTHQDNACSLARPAREHLPRPADTQTTKPIWYRQEPGTTTSPTHRPDLLPYPHTDDPVGILPAPAKPLFSGVLGSGCGFGSGRRGEVVGAGGAGLVGGLVGFEQGVGHGLGP
jgi:hypothetical protein